MLSRADAEGTLAAFLMPDLSPAKRTEARVEGRILGVKANDNDERKLRAKSKEG